MIESDYKRIFLREVNLIDGAKFISVPTAGRFNAGVGTPDILGCINGHMYWVEFKVHPNKLTPMQNEKLQQWYRHGARVYVIVVNKEKGEWVLCTFLQASKRMEVSECAAPLALSALSSEVLEKLLI